MYVNIICNAGAMDGRFRYYIKCRNMYRILSVTFEAQSHMVLLTMYSDLVFDNAFNLRLILRPIPCFLMSMSLVGHNCAMCDLYRPIITDYVHYSDS